MTTLYVSGPMTGITDHNFPAFRAATAQLIEAGYTVIDPAYGTDPEYSWADYLRRGLRDVLDADGVALLDGWQNSPGAVLEVHVAEALGMGCARVEAWLRRATTQLTNTAAWGDST